MINLENTQKLEKLAEATAKLSGRATAYATILDALEKAFLLGSDANPHKTYLISAYYERFRGSYSDEFIVVAHDELDALSKVKHLIKTENAGNTSFREPHLLVEKCLSQNEIEVLCLTC